MGQARSAVALVVAASALAVAACGGPRQPVRARYRPPVLTWAPRHELAAGPARANERCRGIARDARQSELGQPQLTDLIEARRARGQTCAASELMRVYVQRFPATPRSRQYAQLLERLEWP